MMRIKIHWPEFAETRAVGDTAKGLVRVLLESAGYNVYPFGYESFLTRIKDLAHQGKLKKGPVTDRLRSMPDLVVADEPLKTIELVEVKYRSRKQDNVPIGRGIIEKLKKQWPESVLVIVIPFDEVFYAIRLDEIKLRGPIKVGKKIIQPPPDELQNLPQLKDYLIQYEFPRITNKTLKPLRTLAKNMFKDIDLSSKVVKTT